ncbi:MAG: hypothetical protein AABZ61_12145 [Bacteroidota bacterium]
MHQTSVFGRLGARPLNLAEQQKMYLHNGQPWSVTNTPETSPEPFTLNTEEKKDENKRNISFNYVYGVGKYKILS